MRWKWWTPRPTSRYPVQKTRLYNADAPGYIEWMPRLKKWDVMLINDSYGGELKDPNFKWWPGRERKQWKKDYRIYRTDDLFEAIGVFLRPADVLDAIDEAKPAFKVPEITPTGLTVIDFGGQTVTGTILVPGPHSIRNVTVINR